jgi:acetyl-CoA carboxylase beta subunit
MSREDIQPHLDNLNQLETLIKSKTQEKNGVEQTLKTSNLQLLYFKCVGCSTYYYKDDLGSFWNELKCSGCENCDF